MRRRGRFGLEPGGALEIVALVRRVAGRHSDESVGRIVGITGTAVTLVVGPFVFRSAGTPLSGQVSVATVTSILVPVLGGAAFATAYVRMAHRTPRWRAPRLVWRVRDALALTIAAASIAGLAALAAHTVFPRMFQGLLLGGIADTLMALATVAVGCYLLTVIAQD